MRHHHEEQSIFGNLLDLVGTIIQLEIHKSPVETPTTVPTRADTTALAEATLGTVAQAYSTAQNVDTPAD